MPCKVFPAGYGTLVNGLAYLCHTRGFDDALVLMKIEAIRVPWQTHKFQYPARIGLGVCHHILVGHVQHSSLREHLLPMPHQRHIANVITPQSALVVGEIHGVVEQA